MIKRIYNLGGKQLKVSPLLANDGELLRCENFDDDFYGAKKKRPGYVTFLDITNDYAPTNMWSWTKEDGTSTFVYANFGGNLCYYNAGIGTSAAWVTCGNGTVGTTPIGYAVLADTLFISQLGGTTRHSTTGTSFSDTTGAPKGEFLASYQNRIHIGSASTDFWSSTGSGTDWNTSGTSNSSSQTIPGPGKINGMFVANNRLVHTKNTGNMFRWDGYSLVQVPTNEGPSSSYSLRQKNDYWFYLNRNGIQGYNGDRPELLSNVIERQIYNNSGSAIAGSVFDSAPAEIYRNDYFLTVGTVADDLTEETISNNTIVYNYSTNRFRDYSFAVNPTCWTTYKDNTGAIKLIFGDSTGQCYTFGGTATSDNTTAIQAVMEGVIHFGKPEQDKLFDEFWAMASPGCCAKVQVAVTDTFTKSKKNWVDIGEFKNGIARLKFTGNNRGKLLCWKVSESSTNAPFTIYGFSISYDPV